jgi:hypothetical protein
VEWGEPVRHLARGAARRENDIRAALVPQIHGPGTCHVPWWVDIENPVAPDEFEARDDVARRVSILELLLAATATTL